MTTITVAQRKGGSGKTTATLNLAQAFALSGKKVLLIDLDDQQNLSTAIESVQLTQKTSEDLLLDPEVHLTDAAVATVWNDVWIIRAGTGLSITSGRLDTVDLRHKLQGAQNFDLCLIDIGPNLNILALNALCASRWLFVPLSSQNFHREGLSQTLFVKDKIKSRLNPRLDTLGIAFVMHDNRSSLAKQIFSIVKESYPSLLCQTHVSRTIAIQQAQIRGQSILTYAPKHRAAVQYQELAAELSRRMRGAT